jgi:hypothetical protein
VGPLDGGAGETVDAADRAVSGASLVVVVAVVVLVDADAVVVVLRRGTGGV